MGVRVTDGALGWKATIDDSEIDRVAARVEARISGLTKKIKDEGNELENWAKSVAALAAGYASFSGAKDLIDNIIRVRGEFQQLEIAFTTMLKSKDEADKLMAQAVKLAATTPFALSDVASGAKQLLAYGTAAKDIFPTLTMLGNVASGVGAPLNDIVYLYGTLQTQGRAYSKDIQQFTGRGIPIIKELAAQFKVAEGEVMGLVEAGKVGFPEVQKAFQAMTSSSGLFFNLMAEQSKSLTGQLSNLEDSFDGMLNAIGKSNEGILNDGIAGLNLLVENYEKVLTVVGLLVTTYGSYRAALVIEAALAQISAARAVGMTTAELLHLGAITAKTAAMRILNSVMAASPVIAYTALITALTVAIYALSQTTTAAAVATKALGQIAGDYSGKLAEQKLALTEIVRVARDRNITEDERIAAVKKLNELNPQFLGGLNAQNISTRDGSKAIEEYLKWLKAKLQGEAAYAVKSEAVKRIAERNAKAIVDPREKGLSTMDFLGYQLKNIFKGRFVTGDVQNVATDIVKQLNQQDEAIIKAVDSNYKNQLKNRVTGLVTNDTGGPKTTSQNKAFYEAIIKNNTDQLEALDTADKDFNTKAAPLKKRIREAKQALLAFDPEGKAAKKSNDEFQQWTDRRVELIGKISDAYQSAISNQKSQNEQEIDDNKANYKALRDEIEKYNKEAKQENKPLIGRATYQMIDNAQSKEQYEIETKQRTNLILSELQKEKSAYEEFEQYKVDFGEKKAKERFKNEIDLNKTYQQIVEQRLGELLTKDPTEMTGSEKSALEAVKKLNDEAIKAESDKNDALLKQFQTYATKRQLLQETALNEAARLRKLGREQEAQEAINAGIEDVRALDATQIKKMSSYRNLFEYVGKRTKKQILDAIDLYQKELNEFTGVADEKAKAQKELDDLKKSVKDDGGKTLETVVYQLERIGSEFASINGDIGNIATVLLSAARSYVEIQKNLKTVKDPKASTTDKIGAGLGIAGAAISVATTVFGYFKGLKEAKEAAWKAMDDYQAAAIKGELEYQALIRKREQDDIKRGKNSYQAIIDQLELLKKQSPEIEKAYNKIFAAIQGESFTSGVGYQHGTWLRKAKTWDIMASLAGSQYADLEKLYTQGKLKDQAKADFESLKALKEELKSAGIEVEQLQGQLNEMLTGTSVGGLADSLSQLFENGKFAAKDFGDSFEQIMKKAITNSFKYKLLEDGLQPFYDEFSSLFTKGTPTKDQLDALKAQYVSLGQGFADKFKELENITGVSLTDKDGKANPVSGSITAAGLTEDTANKSMGIWRAQFDLTKTLVRHSEENLRNLVLLGKNATDQLNAATANLRELQQINANTYRMANNTDNLDSKLDKIIANTSSGSSYQNLLNNGFKP
ncbi:tape measure protein [Pedobacter sp. Leaf132]|uniref:tape measure protein n=1 Tax=Pedobacter sp. Leaf132 TaxID=2876557 RepID=UPI001E4F27B4|nr:tape measure protein [Pedobacter sp. Leaf132]